MGDSGSYGGAPDPGSAREEAERLVAAALAMARSAASEARDRAGAFGPLGQVISEVLDQTGVVPRPSRPGAATPGTPPTDDTAPRTQDGPPPADHPGPPVGEGPAQPDGAGAGASFGAGFATGDPECCVCPVCRSVAALRDPSPELAERLATGAGDFAAGVASLLRALSSVTDPAGRRTGAARTAGPATGDGVTGDNWAAATRTAPTSPSDPRGTRSADVPGPWRDTVWREATSTRHDSWPAGEQDDVWAAATRAEAGTRETGTTTGPDRATPAGAEQARPAASPATGRPPVPASRTPEGPVATGSGEHAAPGEDG
ncbi:hypothetical protein AAH979_10655 [Plantactinospora sp. ZYX-F-223]|uniref:hypothetical protein n=1 Tax=Plantactinospora sp. ZYX-F-223 TaxID=3144103 RepID=UPI0031FC1F71